MVKKIKKQTKKLKVSCECNKKEITHKAITAFVVTSGSHPDLFGANEIYSKDLKIFRTRKLAEEFVHTMSWPIVEVTIIPKK